MKRLLRSVVLLSVLGFINLVFSPPSRAKLTNLACDLVVGLTLPEAGAEVPPDVQLAKPCENKRVVILSEATRNDPVFFNTDGTPRAFNCVFILGESEIDAAIYPNDNLLYGRILTLLSEGALPAMDAQCDVTVAVAYRNTSTVPHIAAADYQVAVLESNQDLLQKLRSHVTEKTIFLGHGEGAYQACQLIRGNNLSRQALPAFKLINLSYVDFFALGASTALLQPLGLSPNTLCPQSGVVGIHGKKIPIEYQINSRDERYGTIPNTTTALGQRTTDSYQTLFNAPSLVVFATQSDNAQTAQVEGLGLTLDQYKQAFTYVFEDPDLCAPPGGTLLAQSYFRYTLFCSQTRLLRQLKYFDYLAETPWPALHQNSQNWDFALADGAECYAFQYRVLKKNRIITAAVIHPDGNTYVTTVDDLTTALLTEPVEISPYCHIHKVNQATGDTTCVSPDDVGTGARSWGPLILKDGTYLLADLDEIYAFNPDNTVKWRRPYAGVSRSPTTTQDGNIVIMTEAFQGLASGFIYIVNPEDGRDMITPVSIQTLGGYAQFTDTTNTPAVDPTTGDIINSVDFPPDPVTGIASGAYLSFKYIPGENGALGQLEKNWSFPIPGVSFSSPTVAANGTVFANDGLDTTNAILRDGSVLWSYNVGNLSAASHGYNPVTGNVFIVTGRLAGGATSNIAGLFAIDQKGKLIWTTLTRKPSEQFTMTTVPALTQNGYLYGITINLNPNATGSKLDLVVMSQATGRVISRTETESVAGGFTTFNDQNEAFVTDLWPQPLLFNASQVTLAPGAIVGLHKYQPADIAQCKPGD